MSSGIDFFSCFSFSSSVDEDKEVLEDQLTRQLTREYLELLGKFLKEELVVFLFFDVLVPLRSVIVNF